MKNPTVTTSALAAKVARRTGLPKTQAFKAVLATIGVIEEEITAGNRVALVGLGHFGVKLHQSRNLAGMVALRRIPARHLPTFVFTQGAMERLRRDVQQ